MKILATVMLVVLSTSAYGSRPIVEGDGIACIRGGEPSDPVAVHTVSFNNDVPVTLLSPGVLGAMVVLNASTPYNAAFKVGGLTTQTITFGFKDFPGNAVCFRYDKTKNVWSVGETPPDLCHSCSLSADGT